VIGQVVLDIADLVVCTDRSPGGRTLPSPRRRAPWPPSITTRIGRVTSRRRSRSPAPTARASRPSWAVSATSPMAICTDSGSAPTPASHCQPQLTTAEPRPPAPSSSWSPGRCRRGHGWSDSSCSQRSSSWSVTLADPTPTSRQAPGRGPLPQTSTPPRTISLAMSPIPTWTRVQATYIGFLLNAYGPRRTSRFGRFMFTRAAAATAQAASPEPARINGHPNASAIQGWPANLQAAVWCSRMPAPRQITCGSGNGVLPHRHDADSLTRQNLPSPRDAVHGVVR
jgi:hypothetical protein